MQTIRRTCVHSLDFPYEEDGKSHVLQLIKGKKYRTSAEKDGRVVVFSALWLSVDAKLFEGYEELTPP